MDRRDYNNEEREVFNNDRGIQPRRRFNYSRSDYQNYTGDGEYVEPNKPVYPQQPYSPYPQQPMGNVGGYEVPPQQGYQSVPPQQPQYSQPYPSGYYAQQDDGFAYDARFAPQEVVQKKKGFFSFKSKKQPTYSQGDLQNILIVTPKTLSEVQDIIDSLRNRQAIIVQFNKINEKYAQRILDFLNGAIYALGGCEQRIGDNMFLFTPGGVSIQGPSSLKNKY
ncbi:MAG: cell division protein SepF [Clostridia bacterium]|nr:cell division protein SepF [Clostridia bacterium]MDE7328316.1 cell division protein SepF [Clostridia bacterium]